MEQRMFDLSGQVIIVTGAMGQLGSRFALTLLEGGARVAVVDNLIEHAGKAERFGEQADGPNILFVKADVTSRASLDEALQTISTHWGTPFGLINAAALDSPPNAPAEENGPFETYPSASWDKVMEVNVKGTMLCCQVFGGAMAEAGRGSIINICSTYGMVAPDQRLYDYRRTEGEAFFKPVSYSASKSALLNLTRYLATYWADRGVRVNTMTLGGVFNGQDPKFLAEYCARVPMGRMADKDDYNGAVVFLLSNAAAYMTGSNLVIDGGWTAW
jgi:NAD(P)-dependent dehydrogenase (short-subunit alcohol dehydrogenase family)